MGRHSEARVHAAERLRRKASCQPPAEGKTTGHQAERFGKRTSQGRFQLAQHVITAVSRRERERQRDRERAEGREAGTD